MKFTPPPKWRNSASYAPAATPRADGLALPERIPSLDVLKCLACFLVVQQHCGAPWPLISVTKMSVPLFFLVTGWFFPQFSQGDHFSRHLRKVLRLALFLLGGYAALTAAYWLLAPYPHLAAYEAAYPIVHFFVWLLLGDTSEPFVLSGWHYWYFPALIISLFLLRAIVRRGRAGVLFGLMPVLFTLMWLQPVMPIPYVWQIFTYALPYLALGLWLRLHAPRMLAVLTPGRLVAALVATLLLFEGEAWLYCGIPAYAGKGRFFLLPVLSALTFLFFIQRPKLGAGSWLARIGRDYSPYVYLWHMMVLLILSPAMSLFPFPASVRTVMYALLAFLVSIALIWTYRKARQLLLHRGAQ